MSTEEQLSKVKQRVERLMHDKPETRNSDKLLVVKYLETYHGIHSFTDLIDKEIPSLETITRTRRKLQREGKFLASKEVQTGRTENEKIHKHYYKEK